MPSCWIESANALGRSGSGYQEFPKTKATMAKWLKRLHYTQRNSKKRNVQKLESNHTSLMALEISHGAEFGYVLV